MSINEIATISPVVRDDGWKKNGTNIVRLRLTFKRQSRYIKTNIMLRKSQLGKNGQFKDVDLRMKTDALVKTTEDRIALINPFALQEMKVDDLVKYLQRIPEDPDKFKLDFFSFADSVIYEKTGQSQKTYRTALVRGQVFRVYFYEKGGARNLVLTFGQRDVNRCKRLN